MDVFVSNSSWTGNKLIFIKTRDLGFIFLRFKLYKTFIVYATQSR